MASDINRARGHVQVSGPDGVEEYETFTCAHCPRMARIRKGAPERESGRMCRQCMAMICPACAPSYLCRPWELKLYELESRERLCKAAGI